MTGRHRRAHNGDGALVGLALGDRDSRAGRVQTGRIRSAGRGRLLTEPPNHPRYLPFGSPTLRTVVPHNFESRCHTEGRGACNVTTAHNRGRARDDSMPALHKRGVTGGPMGLVLACAQLDCTTAQDVTIHIHAIRRNELLAT
jgi:hypothetical protein